MFEVAQPSPPCSCAPTFPIPRKKGFCDFRLIREGVSESFCSLVYSGELRRGRDDIFVETTDSNQVVREFVRSSKASKEYLLLIKELTNKKIRKMEIAQKRWTATWEGRLQHCLVGQVSYLWSLLGQN
ncbi:hypothetical protein GQ457_05G020830 [Hibiscus cannabinus]